MSISLIPPDTRRRDYTLAGGETFLPAPFPFFAATDLRVFRRVGAVVTQYVLGVDYTVGGAGNPAGGWISLVVPGTAGDVVTVQGAQPVERSAEFVDGGPFRAAAINAELARLVINQQELARDGAQAIRGVPDDPPMSPLPPVASRINGVLAFDAQGQPFVAPFPGAGANLTGDASLATVVAAGGTLPRSLADWTRGLAGAWPGASPPAEPYPQMLWADTGAGVLRQRNTANTAWLALWPLDAVLDTHYVPRGEFPAQWQLRSGIFHAGDFGTLGVSAAGNVAAIQAAIDAAGAAGGGVVLLPWGSFDIDAQLVIHHPRVRLRGRGLPGNHDAVGQAWATRLRWTGPGIPGAMVLLTAISGSGQRRLVGAAVEDLYLDGNFGIGRALELRSAFHCHVRGVLLNHCNAGFGGTAALVMSVIDTLAAGEARDTQNCLIEDMTIRALHADASGCFIALGDDVANVSFNDFRAINYFHRDNNGWVWGNSDHNNAINLRGFRPSGSAASVIFSAADSPLRTSRKNFMQNCFARGGVLVQGTAAAAVPADDNIIRDLDTQNGLAPLPIIGVGAGLRWRQGKAAIRAASTGYIEMDNEILWQWGATTVPATSFVDVTLPVAFQVEGWRAFAQVIGSVASAIAPPTIQFQSASQIRVTNGHSNSFTIAWQVIGR